MKINLFAKAAFGAALLLYAPAALAQQDDAITIAIAEEPNNLDPCNISSGYIGGVIRQNIVETLTKLDPATGEVVPVLATEWERLQDGNWRFKLREGVTFHDGTPFNAEAVVATVKRMFDPDLTCLDRNKFGDTVVTATAVDEYTVDLMAEPARAILPTLLIFLGMSSPNTSDAELTREPVGTGPFKLLTWDAGQQIVVERNDGYWGEQPEVAQATYVFRDNSALRAAMVEVGEADIGTDLAPQDATNPELDHTYFNAETTRIRMIMQPPLDDIRVRKALNLAFDREAMIGTVMSEGVVPATQFFLPQVLGYNDDLEVWPYDPEQAMALVEEARADGVPVDKDMRLIGRIGYFTNQDQMLQTIEQMWEAVGFNIQVEMMETANWLKLVNKPYDADRPAMFIQEMHDNVTGDAEVTMINRYSSAGRQTETNIPELDALLTEAREASGEERDRLFAEANRMVAEDIVPAIPQFHMVSHIRLSPRLDFDPSHVQRSLLELSQIGFSD